MSDLYTVSRVSPGLSPLSAALSRTCGVSVRPRKDKPPVVPGQPVLLGWPVLMSCPASKHNTQEAGIARKGRARCVCPQAKVIRERVRERERIRKREEARAAGVPEWGSPEHRAKHEKLSGAALVSVRRATEHSRRLRRFVPLVSHTHRQAGNLPACSEDMRPQNVLAEDFFNEGTSDMDLIIQARAIQLCHACPVQASCLSGALGRREEFGIWGGLTARERKNPSTYNAVLRRLPAPTQEAS